MNRQKKNITLLLVLLGLTLAGSASQAQIGPWVITTDFSLFGRLRSVEQTVPWSVSSDLATIPGDAAGRSHQGLVYIVGRGGANLLQIYDPADGFSLVREFSLGDGRNPQDIAFAPDGSAYVSCYDAAVLLRVDTDTGTILDTFDTSQFADTDGLPETSWMRVCEENLYLTCQLLDRGNWYAPTGPGMLLVFDLTTRSWRQPISLVGANPYTRIRPFTGLDGQTKLAVGCVGNYTLFDGGIEVVDPATGQSAGYLATESDLNGDVLNFVFTDPENLYALISSPAFATSIVHLNYVTGAKVVTDASSSYSHADLAFDGDFQLLVADRTVGAAGIRVFDVVSDVELTSGPLATGLPPFLFIMPEEIPSSPVGAIPGAGLTMGQAYPNPCNPTARVQISGKADQELVVSVYNLRGQRVSTTTLRTDQDGRATFVFNGHDQTGADLSSGMYRVVAGNSSSFAARGIVLIK